MRTHTFLIILSAAIFFSACTPPTPSSPIKLKSNNTNTTTTQAPPPLENQKEVMSPNEKTLADFGEIEGKTVTLTTTKGDVVIELYREEAPLTTANFLSLVNSGFYNGIVFHRVIADFMAQVGDPLTKDPSKKAMWGTGDPGYSIADEFGPGLTHSGPGIVSMANSGPNTGGSQFFITYAATDWLDGKHAIFGNVTQGMDIVEQITVGDSIVSTKVE